MPAVKLHVQLLSCTPSPEEVVAMGARLCYSDATIDDLLLKVESHDQRKYLGRLMALGHLSPIEHATFTFGIEGVSRALLAQITRHRIASFSVKSQRYVGAVSKAEGATFDYIVPPSIEALGENAAQAYHNQMAIMQTWYDGWAEMLGPDGYEDARFVLPNAAETKLIMTMNARELLHFFTLRCCSRAQWEIRELAWQMLALVKEECPVLFEKAGPACMRGPCPEGAMSCKHAGGRW